MYVENLQRERKKKVLRTELCSKSILPCNVNAIFYDCQCINRDNDTNDSSLVYSPFPAHLVIPYVKVGFKDWGLNYMEA